MFFKYLKFLYKQHPFNLIPLYLSFIPWIFFVINFHINTNLIESLLLASTGFFLMIGIFIYLTNYYKFLSFFSVSFSLILHISKQIYFKKLLLLDYYLWVVVIWLFYMVIDSIINKRTKNNKK